MTRDQMIRQRLIDRVEALLARYQDRFFQDTTASDDDRIRRWNEHDVPPMSAADAQAMTELVDALVRVDAGTYGTCDVCGDAIGHQRMLEFPTTTLCETCSEDEGWRPSRSPG